MSKKGKKAVRNRVLQGQRMLGDRLGVPEPPSPPHLLPSPEELEPTRIPVSPLTQRQRDVGYGAGIKYFETVRIPLRKYELEIRPGERLEVEEGKFSELVRIGKNGKIGNIGMRNTPSGATGFRRYKVLDKNEQIVRSYIEYTGPTPPPPPKAPPFPPKIMEGRGLPLMPITPSVRGLTSPPPEKKVSTF